MPCRHSFSIVSSTNRNGLQKNGTMSSVGVGLAGCGTGTPSATKKPTFDPSHATRFGSDRAFLFVHSVRYLEEYTTIKHHIPTRKLL